MTQQELKEIREYAERCRGDFYEGSGCETALKLLAEIDARDSLLRRIEPHLDAIVCYASTMNEHEPNRLAADVRAALDVDSQPPPTAQ